jgi:hypothetical protein
MIKLIGATILVLGIVLTPVRALADDQPYTEAHDSVYLKFGGSLREPDFFNNKLIAIGFADSLGKSIFDYQLEGGMFANNAIGGTTGYGGPSLGVSIIERKYYIKAFAGPAVITRLDDHLSTPIVFNIDFEIGLKNTKGEGIGIGYKHLSNGGIQSPNLGRDFLYLKVMVP